MSFDTCTREVDRALGLLPEAEVAPQKAPEDLLGALPGAIRAAILPLKGQSYPAPKGEVVFLSVLKPLRDRETKGLEFVVPLRLRYTGEGWDEAEEALVQAVESAAVKAAQSILGNGSEGRLVRRTKTSPFLEPNERLLMLRFRLTPPPAQS
jgi:hypothetical protein